MRVYTALKQSHLPKMDEAGVVEYDDARGISRLTDATADIECYLNVVPADDIPWSQYYLDLGLFSSAFAILAWIGLTPLSTLGGFGWAVLISSSLVVSAIVHRYREQSIALDSGRPALEHR